MIGTPWLIGGAALALVLMYAGWSIQVANIRAESAFLIGEQQKATRAVEKQWGDYKLEVEQTISNNALQYARELEKERDEKERLAADNEKLRVAYAAVERQRNEASQQLVKALNNAQLSDVNQLGAAVREYLDGVRRQQADAGAADHPPAGNSPACERLSDGGFRCSVLPLRASRAD